MINPTVFSTTNQPKNRRGKAKKSNALVELINEKKPELVNKLVQIALDDCHASQVQALSLLLKYSTPVPKPQSGCVQFEDYEDLIEQLKSGAVSPSIAQEAMAALATKKQLIGYEEVLEQVEIMSEQVKRIR